MNKVISFLSLLFLTHVCTLFANAPQLTCDPQLKPYLSKILQLQEARELITSIQKEGPIKIGTSDAEASKQFGAFWDMDLRMVCVDLNEHTSEGEVIGSILFELQNALVTSYYDQLDVLAKAGKINKDKYIESFERQEYFNSKNAAAIAEKGIKLGIFPANARLPTYRNFEEHYHYQKIGGHSAYIARNYDQLVNASTRA